MNFFHKNNALSPVSQDFIWLAEYNDGTYFPEFNFIDKKSNSFFAIDKNKISKFGLIGKNIPMYFSVFGGTFFLDGHMVDFNYKLNNSLYKITGQKQMYNDIVTFKDAFADLHPKIKNSAKNNIQQYNFGYRKEIVFEEFSLQIKVLCEVPSKNNVRINISIVSSSNLDGELIVLRNKSIYHTLKAPIHSDLGGKFVWEVK